MMPSKKKKYNARFPPARIKKIMQSNEEVGKVAAAVPVVISRALELFITSLILDASQNTKSRNAKTLSPFHIKQAIEGDKQFDFLRDVVRTIAQEEDENDETGDAKRHRCKKVKGGAKKQDAVSSGAQGDQSTDEGTDTDVDNEIKDDSDDDNDDDLSHKHFPHHTSSHSTTSGTTHIHTSSVSLDNQIPAPSPLANQIPAPSSLANQIPVPSSLANQIPAHSSLANQIPACASPDDPTCDTSSLTNRLLTTAANQITKSPYAADYVPSSLHLSNNSPTTPILTNPISEHSSFSNSVRSTTNQRQEDIPVSNRLPASMSVANLLPPTRARVENQLPTNKPAVDAGLVTPLPLPFSRHPGLPSTNQHPRSPTVSTNPQAFLPHPGMPSTASVGPLITQEACTTLHHSSTMTPPPVTTSTLAYPPNYSHHYRYPYPVPPPAHIKPPYSPQLYMSEALMHHPSMSPHPMPPHSSMLPHSMHHPSMPLHSMHAHSMPAHTMSLPPMPHPAMPYPSWYAPDTSIARMTARFFLPHQLARSNDDDYDA